MHVGVLSSKFGYPVEYPFWHDLIDPAKMDMFDLQEEWNTFAVHLWNQMSKGSYKIEKYLDQEEVPLTKLFRQNCPVYFNLATYHKKA